MLDISCSNIISINSWTRVEQHSHFSAVLFNCWTWYVAVTKESNLYSFPFKDERFLKTTRKR